MDKQVEIHSDDYIGRDREIVGVAIICAPTGILCTAQVGGLLCLHPQIEGYTIPLQVEPNHTMDFLGGLNILKDCEHGCCLIHPSEWHNKYKDVDLERDKINRNTYAEAISQFLEKSFNHKNAQQMLFTFDYDRINELTEGWWPVLVQFTEWFSKEAYDTKFKGYLHFGNCD